MRNPLSQAMWLLLTLAVSTFALQQPTISGLPPTAPAGKSWILTWYDEFDGNALDLSKWVYRPDAKRRDGWWNQKMVGLDGLGHLVIRTVKEGDAYLDGCITTQGKFEHAFGYYVARVQLQRQPGHWPTFWITGRGVSGIGNGGRSGMEIDVMEKPWLNDQVQHALHWDGYGQDHKSESKVVTIKGVMEGFHTFGLLWQPDG